MVNQPTTSYSHEYDDLENKEEEKKVCESSLAFDVSINTLLEIIKTKESDRYRPPSSTELRRVLIYKKWESKINNGSKLIINTLLNSFAKKLNEINCGSLEEKKEFLSIVSGGESIYYPFRLLNDLMIEFVNEKISKELFRCVELKLESPSLINISEYSTNIKEMITTKAKEALLKYDNQTELINNISNKINKLHKDQCIKKDLVPYFDTEKNSFATFIDLYIDHTSENYEYMLSKFINIFDSLGQDEECCMSFVFDRFLGETIILSRKAEQLRNIIFTVGANSRREIRELFSAGADMLVSMEKNSDCFRAFVDKYKKELEEKITECLREKKYSIIIEDNEITNCKETNMEKILYCSKKCLEENLVEGILRRGN
ncbi:MULTISPECIES: hypothetical protein [Candidatus Ichthyocystis]|uniref:Putative coiled coil protein n=1 Tax=Candidatus Ichthyocystis hellenicum TaxID=1561003 RepID=A0A0S4M7K8_9BURK|nr:MULTISPECIES: hypothetical protein [Ichthyocystis]CUT18120.1 putative coiled coil protein [Candidatus Ichthyocystis hellenicum]